MTEDNVPTGTKDTVMIAPKTVVMFPLDRVLRTEDGKLDLSGNNRDPKTAYSNEEFKLLKFQIESKAKLLPELNGGTGIEQPLWFRKVPAPPWQKVEGKNGDWVAQPMKGHRRVKVAEELGYEKVPALIYEEVDENTFLSIVSDHGGEAGLNEYELYKSMVKGIERGWDKRQIFNHVRPTLMRLGKISVKAQAKLAEFGDDEEKKISFLISNTWNGKFIIAAALANVPHVLSEAYFKKLRKEQAWPDDNQLREGNQLHNEDKLNPDGTRNLAVTRSNPGPKFQAFWDKLQAAVAVANNLGVRPKGTSMLGRAEHADILEKTESVIVRVADQYFLNNTGFTKESFLEWCKEVTRLEQEVIGKETMDKLLAAVPPLPAAPTNGEKKENQAENKAA